MIDQHTLANEQAIDILTRYRDMVWPLVKAYLTSPQYPEAFALPGTYAQEHNLHWHMVVEYPSRQGKYLRPTLLILTCEALGGDTMLARNTAAAMQLAEEWMLIHDDWEDGSVERRGGPTLHRLYGPALANNAGDALHAIMWKVLFENTAILGVQKTSAILEEFYCMMMRTMEGQSTDLYWIATNKTDVSDNDCLFLSDSKTGYYSCSGPMRLGAIIAGAAERQLDALAAFGVILGRCFQLVDDILDVTQDVRRLKKQHDLYEGKRTVMLGHLLRSVSDQERMKLVAFLAKDRKERTAREVEWVMEMMERHGSIQYAKDLAKDLKEQAVAMFGQELCFLRQRPARDNLRTLINFVLDRDH